MFSPILRGVYGKTNNPQRIIFQYNKSIYTMSSTLVNRSLCADATEYEAVLSSLSVVRSLLDCDGSGNIEGVSVTLLTKMFSTTNNVPDGEGGYINGAWVDASNNICSGELPLYVYGKDCSFLECQWAPISNDCINDAIAIVGGGPYDTFKEMYDAFATYLGAPLGETLTDVLTVLIAMCDILVQRVTANRSLRKTSITVNECDL
jgi:hypothetical protein